jgi:outer membrane protein assembly factor BamE (lipoprotein component of BamABCDE complex)
MKKNTIRNVMATVVVTLAVSGCADNMTKGSSVSSGTRVGEDVYASLKEGSSTYDQVVGRLGKPTSSHTGITVEYRFEQTTERGKGFEAILGGVGQKKVVVECVTLVFDGETKKLLSKRTSDCS